MGGNEEGKNQVMTMEVERTERNRELDPHKEDLEMMDP